MGACVGVEEKVSGGFGSPEPKANERKEVYQERSILPSDGYSNFLNALSYLMFPSAP